MKKSYKILFGLLFLIIVIVFANQVGLISIKFNESVTSKGDSEVTVSSEDDSVVFDASQYWITDSKTISESDFVKLMGEPDSIEEWNYEASYQVLVDKTPVYAIRTLYYGNYEYLFNSDMLQRINIYDEFSYEDTDDILEMFGLKEYSNTKIKNNNVSYRATDCGVPDFWVYSMDGDSLNGIKISYGTFWQQ